MNQEEDFMIQLGHRLKKVRKARGYKSREDLAVKIGIHLSTYGNYERGKRIPDAVFIEKFCATLHVNHIWLFTGRGGMALPDNPMGLETKLLECIMEKVEEYMEQTKSILTSQKKAEVISILYEEALENQNWQDELGIDSKTKRFIKLLAG